MNAFSGTQKFVILFAISYRATEQATALPLYIDGNHYENNYILRNWKNMTSKKTKKELTFISKEHCPWDLSKTPNYKNALSIPVISAADLNPQEFYRNYVALNKPCLLQGAVKHWPAYKNWCSLEYLKRETENPAMKARVAPASEYAHMAEKDIVPTLQQHNIDIFQELTFHEFLDRAHTRSEQLVLHSIPLLPGHALGELCKDLSWYSFLTEWKGSRMYPRFRAFFYRNSYTDWHFHPTDEALMSQVVGSKEVLLLPPDSKTWDALYPPATKTGYLYNVDTEKFPKIQAVMPYRVTVNAGDALYIPVYWWHAVASVDDHFGITVASTFKSPVHVNGDLRYPGARYIMRRFLFTRFAPMMLTGVAYAYAHRLYNIFGKKRLA